MENVETIKVRPETKRRLTEIAGMLEQRLGRRVSYDEVINYLIEEELGKRRGELRKRAEDLFGLLKGVDLYSELVKGRREDEEVSA
ncbi:MAG: hypothetical protein ACP5HQ_05770 [Thermoprotei archaeon]